MKRAYDRQEAQRLLPLLRSIVSEIEERATNVRHLAHRLRRLRDERSDERAQANAVAELAEQKRELRHAHEELEALGCAVDPTDGHTVLIPGEDGRLWSGYELRIDSGRLTAAPAPAA